MPATLRDSERALILDALEAVGWVIGGPGGAAARLGLNRTTLINMMKRLGIERPTRAGLGREMAEWTPWRASPIRSDGTAEKAAPLPAQAVLDSARSRHNRPPEFTKTVANSPRVPPA